MVFSDPTGTNTCAHRIIPSYEKYKLFFYLAVAGQEFKNTSWVNHFATQSTEIGNLSPDLYQFKTVARNGYPTKDNPEESPASDITEGRPLPRVVSKFCFSCSFIS